jgi:phosphoenolpyruvate-protein phosphotransferase (PTS system enzyme I)
MPDGKKKDAGEVILHGIGVSPGVVIGPVYILAAGAMNLVHRQIDDEELGAEVERFEQALIDTRTQIRRIQGDLEKKTGLSDASILDAHLMVLDDRAFLEEVISGITSRRINAEVVVHEVADKYAAVLAAVEDDYLRERVADVRDVAKRIIKNLSGDHDSSLMDLQGRHIVVAVDLAPSETAMLRKDMVMGFVTNLGSPTSHTAVMARALEIPAVVGLRDVTTRVSNEDEVLIDGNKGVFILRPSAEQMEKYGKVALTRQTIQNGLTSLKSEPAKTKDGHRITLAANIEGTDEVQSVSDHGAEGVGLFRSEYLYLSRERVLTEEEQSAAYTDVAVRLAPATVIIRTLDLGGDKYLPEAHLPREANPFLGCRSIRLSLLYPAHFRAQLRAILRASVKGNVKIMYPMISNVTEVIKANEILEEAKKDLDSANEPYDRNIEVGIMIEIPAAALIADILARKVKFFSIGTNDLVQYTMAVDRVNERVAYLYEPSHPAVLKLIRNTVEAGHRNGIWVGVCGEMAGDPLMTPLLVGMGVDELSVAPVAVPLVKDAIRQITYEEAKELVRVADGCETSIEVLHHCRSLLRKTAPELMDLI